MKKALISNIQKYSIHDGSGIRTTVFFKGCPLSCIWCHNPETQDYKAQFMVHTERCTGCGICVEVCQQKAVSIQNGKTVTDSKRCIQCGDCVDECIQNCREVSGTYYTVHQLITEIEKDLVFYEQSNGGVTLSGGEVLTQDIDFLEELLSKLHEKGIRINIDTAGHVPYDVIEKILPFVDFFLYDIKLLDPNRHKLVTGVDNSMILENLNRLSKAGANLWIRIPIIGGVNNNLQDIEQIGSFLKENKIVVQQIHLLAYHNTGQSKYERLGIVYEGMDYTRPTERELEEYLAYFQNNGFSQVFISN